MNKSADLYERAASSTHWPRPSRPAIISQTTARISETVSPSRRPARMSGAAEGSEIFHAACQRESRSAGDLAEARLDGGEAVHGREQQDGEPAVRQGARPAFFARRAGRQCGSSRRHSHHLSRNMGSTVRAIFNTVGPLFTKTIPQGAQPPEFFAR
jgi:hypothetical protein